MTPATTIRCALAGATLIAFAASPLAAQSDRTVTTTRDRPVPLLPAEVAAQMRLSEQPRYFLDTIDNLNRETNDLTRLAPGLAKNNYQTKAFPVYNTNAIEIQSYLLRTLAYEGGIAEVMGAPGVVDEDGRPVQFLIVTAPDFMMPGIIEMVSLTDRSGFVFNDQTGADFGGGPGAVRYVAKHRTASELVGILEGTELGNIGAFLFPPFADDSTNSIYIVDNPTDIADDLAALEMFDVPPLMVELEVAIYEVAEANRARLGLDWDAWKGFFGGEFGYSSESGGGFFSSSNDVYSTMLTLDARALAAFLNYTAQTGTTDLATHTKVTMVNSEDNPGGLSGGARGAATGNPAVIEAVTVIPYSRFGGETSFQKPSEYHEVVYDEGLAVFEGVRVSILPFIGTESITLSIDAQVNSLVGFSKRTATPLIAERKVNSVMNVRDGVPIVLGSLDKTATVESTVGVPVLKDIPVLGKLFGVESSSVEKSKVLVVVTPRLVNSAVPADVAMLR